MANALFRLLRNVRKGTWYANGIALIRLLSAFLVFVVETIEVDDSQLISIEAFGLPRAVYVCVAIEFIATLGAAINLVPTTRLIEGAVCQRFYEVEMNIEEQLCKSDGVQSDMAYLLGVIASFGSVPSLLLTIPYAILSEHVDRRFILLANALSSILKLLFDTAVCYAPHSNLKLLWVSPLSEIVGGGGPVFMMLIRTIIAENVHPSSLSTVLYRLSGAHLLLRLGGVSLGSWLMQSGAASTILIGICTASLTLPLLTFLPESVKIHASPSSSDDNSINLTYMKYDHEPDLVSPENIVRRRCLKSDMVVSLKSLSFLMLFNRTFNMCLAIMFLNMVALDARTLLRPWLSKRYEWTLAETGYILSLESILSVILLFILQYFDSASSWKAKDDKGRRRRELRIARMSILCGIIGSVILCFADVQALFFVAAIIISGSAGFLDAIKAFFTAQLDKEHIGKLYSSIMVIDTLATILSSSVWSALYALGYSWGGMWVGLPFLCSAGVFSLVLVLLVILKP